MALKKLPDYLRKAEKVSTKQGWIWEVRNSKHLMVFDNEGNSVLTLSLTAYDGTLRKQATSRLRRAGCPGL